MKTTSSEQAIQLLEQSIPSTAGTLTVPDAAVASGLSMEEARSALETLMNKYVCRLQVTESGEILYNFGEALQRRDKKTLKEHLQTVGNWLWKAFKVGFKVWITVTLVVYFVLYVLLLLALILYSRDEDGIFDLKWIGDLFSDLFWFAPRNMAVVYAMDGEGYRHRSLQQRKRKKLEETEKKKRFVQSVYDFVFGPARQGFDPFANEKEVAAWLRENRGLLTMTEIVALAGWTYEEASEKMADYLTRFGGDATISDDGVLIGNFDRLLMRGDGEMQGGEVELFWDEYEAPFEQTGNSSGRNAAIIGMNAFNILISASLMLSPLLMGDISYMFGEIGIPSGAATLFLGIIPMAFSSIFFLVPLLRWKGATKREAERKIRNRKRFILRQIFDRPESAFSLKELHNQIKNSFGKTLSESELQELLDQIVSEYGGRTILTESGTVLYRFERIAHEETVVARVRAEKKLIEGPGTVIFDTAPSLESGKAD